MKDSEVILKRQKYNIRFKNNDMDFIFNWVVGISQIIGMSAAQVFYAVHDIKDGDPTGWREGFRRQGKFQLKEAEKFEHNKQNLASGQAYMGAAYAFRASLQYADPTADDFNERVREMEEAFEKGVRLIGAPVKSIEVPFENITLPGYYLEHDNKCRPTLMMVGGGDTFREDLFYFAGYPGWKRGYNVLMVDLPGQGKVPGLGHCFRTDMNKPISAALDWLEANAAVKPEKIAIYGVSGGGFFTAQAVASDRRIKAWIASTPIIDIAELFRKEFGSALKTPGWLLNTFMKVTSALNESADINLKKYAWQFGSADFKTAIDRVFTDARSVNSSDINCPCLFLMGENEAEELKRQTSELYNTLRKRGKDVTLREFTAAEGADAHCQLNNLRLAHMVVFDWLDDIFDYKKVSEQIDTRMLC
ncbi:dipeptidyl aminopeptidase [Thermoanaerobacterium thermosaccharolyticum]|uniref:Dipeptidyl aminopeptidase n=1 Tax=Thermoanaerobacterium thermosaccharolyticum TaxID=1517 RepID=A0A223I127_THETR|nr:alpha/beta fold hydrolase [Thermoanaerobacterium thermosaccharolyticum]AST58431.1 dipeptidyl aminopeptidase [Thermoanaerobacterium thermosaccharolyticum]